MSFKREKRSRVKIMPTLFAVRLFYKGNTGKRITLFVPIPVAHRKKHTRKTFYKIGECTLPLVSVKVTRAYVVTILLHKQWCISRFANLTISPRLKLSVVSAEHCQSV